MASKENIYFLRSFLLLIEGGLYISKEILLRECKNTGSDLDELLKRNESKLKHLFHDKQYKKLYPDDGKADITSWDLQLTVGVLLNVFRGIVPAEKQKLRSLRDLRNEIFMHCTSASLDEQKYDGVKDELEDIITTLASTCNKSVQEKCSLYIETFTKGHLDAVRPSVETLNGVSQSCQKKVKIGVNTELTIDCPSEHWITLCERTLDTIFNHAENMTSESDNFQEIKENVKKILDFLENNKDVVFKGSKLQCIFLCFECESYDSFLNFLDDVESEEYSSILKCLSASLNRFFEPQCTISISSRVTTESLQLALIAILKTLSVEEETEKRHCIEVSSENADWAVTARGSSDGVALNFESQKSKKPLLLDFESSSEEGLFHIIQSFRERQFADSLTNVANSLSSYCNGEKVTLKASINVGEMLKALEESVSERVMVHEANKNDGEKTEDDSISLPDKENRIRLIKTVVDLRKVLPLTIIRDLMPTLPPKRYMRYTYMDFDNKRDKFLSELLVGSKELREAFLKALTGKRSYGDYRDIKEHICKQVVSLEDIKALSALEGSMSGTVQRPKSEEPLIKFTRLERYFLCRLKTANGIAAFLLSKMIISPREFSDIVKQDSPSMGTKVLLDNLEKCSLKHLDDFYSALEQEDLVVMTAFKQKSESYEYSMMDESQVFQMKPARYTKDRTEMIRDAPFYPKFKDKMGYVEDLENMEGLKQKSGSHEHSKMGDMDYRFTRDFPFHSKRRQPFFKMSPKDTDEFPSKMTYESDSEGERK